MRSIFVFALALSALLAATPAAAQRAPDAPAPRRVQVALTHAVNVPGGGWGWGEMRTVTGVRVALPFVGGATAWAGAGRADIDDVACIGEACEFTGDAWMFNGGVGYRFGADRAGAVVPYVGAGAALEWWSEGGRRWLPHVHAGADWNVLPRVALRLEAQSEWQVPFRVSTGLRFTP